MTWVHALVSGLMKLEAVCKIVCVYISSFLRRLLNFHHSWYYVPQGQPQCVAPTSWLKMAARSLAKHLSSRQEKEKGGMKRGGQKVPLQFSVSL